jgi:hypothetical protein
MHDSDDADPQAENKQIAALPRLDWCDMQHGPTLASRTRRENLSSAAPRFWTGLIGRVREPMRRVPVKSRRYDRPLWLRPMAEGAKATRPWSRDAWGRLRSFSFAPGKDLPDAEPSE